MTLDADAYGHHDSIGAPAGRLGPRLLLSLRFCRGGQGGGPRLQLHTGMQGLSPHASDSFRSCCCGGLVNYSIVGSHLGMMTCGRGFEVGEGLNMIENSAKAVTKTVRVVPVDSVDRRLILWWWFMGASGARNTLNFNKSYVSFNNPRIYEQAGIFAICVALPCFVNFRVGIMEF